MNRSLKREELYDLVWSKPVRTLAAEFKISDVGLAKVCRANNIPLPPRGYWAKIEAGKSVSRAGLPKRGIGTSDIVSFGTNTQRYNEFDDLASRDLGSPPTFAEPIESIAEEVRKSLGKITIPRDFSRAHRLITKLLEADNQRRADYLASSYHMPWDAPYFDAPFERRRLRLMNALMIAAQRAGANPGFRGKNPTGFDYRVGNQGLALTVDHPKQERANYRSASDLTRPASDTLGVKIHARSLDKAFKLEWQDTPDRKVESDIAEIAVTMIVAAEVQHRAGAVSNFEWMVTRKAQLIEERRKQKEERERRERERLAAEAKARIDSLLADAASHRQAIDIRAYVQAVRQSAGSAERISERLEEWTKWALRQAEQLDPIASGRWAEQSAALAASEQRAKASEN